MNSVNRDEPDEQAAPFDNGEAGELGRDGWGRDNWAPGEAFDPDLVRPFVHRDEAGVSLHFELSSIQSRMSRTDPQGLALDYTRSMMGVLLFKPHPGDVLMIGLGGGSMVKYLHRHVASAALTVVEINPHVVALRNEFEVPADDARLTVLLADGARHVAESAARYDVVMVDGFNYEGQPEALCTPDFYAQCRRCLAPDGVLVVNLHADGDQEQRLLHRIETCFDGQALSIVSADKGNRIVFAGEPCRPGESVAPLRRHWAALPDVHRATLAAVRPALLLAIADRL